MSTRQSTVGSIEDAMMVCTTNSDERGDAPCLAQAPAHQDYNVKRTSEAAFETVIKTHLLAKRQSQKQIAEGTG